MLEIGIIHAKRKVDFTGLTIDNLREELPGFNISVFCERDAEIFDGCSSVKTYLHHGKMAPFFNWLYALTVLYYRTSNPWILICEDDIQWYRGAGEIFLNYLKIASSDVGMISPYCSIPNANPKCPGFGLAKISANGWCGALSLAIPRSLIPKIWDNSITKNEKTGKHLDNLIGRIILSLDKKIIIHTPTIVKHLGTQYSTLLPEGNRALQRRARQAYDYATYCSTLQRANTDSSGATMLGEKYKLQSGKCITPTCSDGEVI